MRHFLNFFLQFGVLGLVLLAIADSSFLFLPLGNDLLLVVLTARHHAEFPIFALAAAAGSVIGVFLLDLVCRKGGEEGLKRIVKPKLLDYLKRRMEQRAAIVIIVSCLSPPPFPFTASIAAASALQYPKTRLLVIVFVSRLIRYGLVGWAAIYFGGRIMRVANSSEFQWIMGCFIAFCLIGSIVSIVHWVRIARKDGREVQTVSGAAS